jgi:acyl-CoA reductase-like NAD-dependent aldehyde dehydrogenase
VESDAEALAQAAQNRYALGASVFSQNLEAAIAMAAQIRAGLVSFNDLIVPVQTREFHLEDLLIAVTA